MLLGSPKIVTFFLVREHHIFYYVQTWPYRATSICFYISSVLDEVEDPSWKTLESALQNIKQGKHPPNSFGFMNSITVNGYKWQIAVYKSQDEDTRPTLEIYTLEIIIKIRYGE